MELQKTEKSKTRIPAEQYQAYRISICDAVEEMLGQPPQSNAAFFNKKKNVSDPYWAALHQQVNKLYCEGTGAEEGFEFKVFKRQIQQFWRSTKRDTPMKNLERVHTLANAMKEHLSDFEAISGSDSSGDEKNPWATRKGRRAALAKRKERGGAAKKGTTGVWEYDGKKIIIRVTPEVLAMFK